MPPSKNGPEREKFSDPDASCCHRSAVSTGKGGGLRWLQDPRGRGHTDRATAGMDCETARAAEANFAFPLIDAAKARGFAMRTAIVD
jgi:hypothetical protein